jgi:hypothetical protein
MPAPGARTFHLVQFCFGRGVGVVGFGRLRFPTTLQPVMHRRLGQTCLTGDLPLRLAGRVSRGDLRVLLPIALVPRRLRQIERPAT